MDNRLLPDFRKLDDKGRHESVPDEKKMLFYWARASAHL